MAKYIPKIVTPLLNYVPSTDVEEITSYASKALRLKIIADRYTRGFEKSDRDGGRGAYEHRPTNAQSGGTNSDSKEHKQVIGRTQTLPTEGYLFGPNRNPTNIDQNYIDSITLVDIDYNEGEHKNSRYYEKLTIPFIPRELNYGVESNFVGIASFGKNNPIYQFTGSEDTLTFTIDWHSNDLNREDVIFKCRWVEALCKADSYKETPHRVKLLWGKENKLFQDHTFILVSAPYTLSQFNRNYRDSDGNIISTHLLPQQAMQNITLKRITTHNLSSMEIIGNVGIPQI